MKETLTKKINSILEKYISKSIEIKENQNLKSDLGMDSLDIVEFIMELEVKFDIQISDADFEDINTIKDCYNLVQKYLKKQ